MDDLLEKMRKEIMNDEDIKGTAEEIDDHFLCLLESISSDTEKVLAMGNSIAKVCSENQFTPFELCTMCGTLIVSAVVLRAEKLGVSGSRVFLKHMLKTIGETAEDELKEMENASKNGDCSCECE